MPLELLIGDDSYRIQQRLLQHKASLDPAWALLNTHRFDATKLTAAQVAELLTTEVAPLACTLPLAGEKQLVIVTNLTLSANVLDAVQWLEHLPKATTLVLSAPSLDKRTKLAKWLQPTFRILQRSILYLKRENNSFRNSSFNKV
jgi:DNA polymerase III delta subunit